MTEPEGESKVGVIFGWVFSAIAVLVVLALIGGVILSFRDSQDNFDRERTRKADQENSDKQAIRAKGPDYVHAKAEIREAFGDIQDIQWVAIQLHYPEIKPDPKDLAVDRADVTGSKGAGRVTIFYSREEPGWSPIGSHIKTATGTIGVGRQLIMWKEDP